MVGMFSVKDANRHIEVHNIEQMGKKKKEVKKVKQDQEVMEKENQ